jgi:hypothetical protein
MSHYKALGVAIHELEGREDQQYGDLRITLTEDHVNIEVKFDEMAAKTGNLCFEMSNGSKMTGIMATKADRVYYVVPNGDGATVYVFDTEKLRAFISDPANVTIKNGGDKRKFVLALAKATKVVEAGLPEEVFEIA